MLRYPCELPDGWQLHSLVFSAESQNDAARPRFTQLGALSGSFEATFLDATHSSSCSCKIDAAWAARGFSRDVLRTNVGVVLKVHVEKRTKRGVFSPSVDEMRSYYEVPNLSKFTPRVYGEASCVINGYKASVLMMDEVTLDARQYWLALFASDESDRIKMGTLVSLLVNWYSLVHEMVMDNDIELGNVPLGKWGITLSEQFGPEIKLLSWRDSGKAVSAAASKATIVARAVCDWLQSKFAPAELAEMTLCSDCDSLMRRLKYVATECFPTKAGRAKPISNVPTTRAWAEIAHTQFSTTGESLLAMLTRETRCPTTIPVEIYRQIFHMPPVCGSRWKCHICEQRVAESIVVSRLVCIQFELHATQLLGDDVFDALDAGELFSSVDSDEWSCLTVKALIHGIGLERKQLEFAEWYVRTNVCPDVFHQYYCALSRCTFNRLPLRLECSLAKASLQLFYLKYYDAMSDMWTCWNASGAYIAAVCRLLKQWMDTRMARSEQDFIELEWISDILGRRWNRESDA